MTPLRQDPLQPGELRQDEDRLDETLALLRNVHARQGLERRILARLDDTHTPSRRFVLITTLVPAFLPNTRFASATLGLVAAAAFGGAVFLAHNRSNTPIFVPAPATPVASHGVATASSTALAHTAIHSHGHSRSHRLGRSAHARTLLPPGAAALPHQLELHAPQPPAAHP
jgi:hypothetical protein